MDPEAALRDAEDFVFENEWTSALDRLAGYFEWRLKGGFQPENGDERALMFMRRICDRLETA